MKKEEPKQLQNSPRVFKCCQNDFIYESDANKCIDPRKTNTFEIVRKNRISMKV